MNKREKELLQLQLKAEEDVIHELEKQYKQALKDINQKVKLFEADIQMLDEAINTDGMDEAAKAMLQSQKRSKVYQKQFQEALQGQINGILDRMQGNNYSTIESYLKGCYEDAFIGTMYNIHGQGVPIIMPIDQAAAVKAIMTDSKISKGLYNSLGVNISGLKKAIRQEITRGIGSGLLYSDIARNIANTAKAPLSRAKTIVRTEGHRIQQQSADDARRGAISRGCDVVKQWDSTLDGKTRPNHRMLDGQIREEDDPFEVAGMKADYPGGFGDPAEDCNCRCVALTRARWALDEDELKTLKERAEYFGLLDDENKQQSFRDFEAKYLKAVESEKVRNDTADADSEILDSIKKKLQGMTPQKSTAAWDEILDIESEAVKELNTIHTKLNEHMIRTQTERVMLFDLSENKTVCDEVGEINVVSLSKNLVNILKKSPANSIIFTHVHPTNGSFSMEDFQKLVSNKSVKALTVELPNGTKYVLDRGTFKTGLFADAKFSSVYDAADKEARAKFSILDSILEEDMTVEIYDKYSSVWHECEDYRNKIIAEKLGMKYYMVTNNE